MPCITLESIHEPQHNDHFIKEAKKLGIRTVAITDHDTVDGIEEALSAGEEHGVRVIPGIELSAESELGNIQNLIGNKELGKLRPLILLGSWNRLMQWCGNVNLSSSSVALLIRTVKSGDSAD